MRIGAVSLSLTTNFQNECGALTGIAAVICGPTEQKDYPGVGRRIPLNRAWLVQPVPVGSTPPPLAEADAAVGRICFTSGSTGRPKAVYFDSPRLSSRLSGTARRTGITPDTVLWCGLGPDTAYGFTATLATWRDGGTVVLSGTDAGCFMRLSAQSANLMLASPAALQQIVRDAYSQGGARLPATVVVAGGRLAPTLRDAISQHFSGKVLIAYGSSETGGISVGDAAGLDRHIGHAGQVFADVQAQVLDATGAPRQDGAPGPLRVRSDSMVAGYLNDPAETQRLFRGGWFHPGDHAELSSEGVLTILGRPSDILNLGGVKIRAEELDEAVRDRSGVADACAVAISGSASPVELAIVVVCPPERATELGAQLRAQLKGLPRFSLIAVRELPRGTMGKLNRAAVASSVEALFDPEAEGTVMQGAFAIGTF